MVVETSVRSPFKRLTRLLTRVSLLDCNLLVNIFLQCATIPLEVSTQDMKCEVVFVPCFD